MRKVRDYPRMSQVRQQLGFPKESLLIAALCFVHQLERNLLSGAQVDRTKYRSHAAASDDSRQFPAACHP